VWTYILRRLLAMIPTLFGVTVVAFCVMQMAPGDPLRAQLGATGAMGESSQTREAYLVQKRELKLDRPLLLNLHYFQDFRPVVAQAAHYRAMDQQQIAAELARLAAEPESAEHAHRLAFLRSLRIERFDRLLADPRTHPVLAAKIATGVQLYCEDTGIYGAPAAFELLREAKSRQEKIGLVRCLSLMVAEPFVYTYQRDSQGQETAQVVGTWRLWWERVEDEFPPLDPDHRAYVEKRFAAMAAEPSRAKVLEMLEGFERADMRFFVEKLLGDATLDERKLAAAALKLYIGRPLQVDLPVGASEQQVNEVVENWLLHYELNRQTYEPPWWRRLIYMLTDTQYAHMCWRLFTFNFGHSATKTREPVSRLILDAVWVSAPLMLMAQLLIYLLAVPLGIVCAVHRGKLADRLISLKLFLLYSIPPYVAGMLFLLFLCYGGFLKWFPSLGLHSPGAENFGFWRWLLDYLWHAFLPVVCLSLFSLAAMAMYSRTSMLDVIGQDYIRTARAKGLSERKVIYKHGLRNALIPIITLFAGFLPAMLGGSVLIEWLFGIPGMGSLSWESIEQKDYPTLMALIFIDGIVVMVSILITDLLYVFIDPRISFEGRGQER